MIKSVLGHFTFQLLKSFPAIKLILYHIFTNLISEFSYLHSD